MTDYTQDFLEHMQKTNVNYNRLVSLKIGKSAILTLDADADTGQWLEEFGKFLRKSDIKEHYLNVKINFT